MNELFPALMLSGGAFMMGVYHFILYLQYRERIIFKYSLYLFSIVLYICFALYFRSIESAGSASGYIGLNESINFIAILCYASFLLEIAVAWRSDFKSLFLSLNILSWITLLFIAFGVITAIIGAEEFTPIINTVSSGLKILFVLVGVWAATQIYPRIKGRVAHLIVAGALVYLFFMALVLISMFLTPTRRLAGFSPIQWFYLGTFVEIVVFTVAMSVKIKEVFNRVTDLRTRLSQDLHDEIGATLTSISFLSEVAKQPGRDTVERNSALEKIGEYSREMIAEISDIVWAINPRNDRLDKIADRMKNFGQTMLAARNISFHFQTGRLIENVTLNTQQRKNLYLVFKEAVNNAAKYSGCSELNVLLEMKNQAIRMRIQDNGKGIDKATAGSGNGIINMKSRAAEIGGILSFETGSSQGTALIMFFPVTQNA